MKTNQITTLLVLMAFLLGACGPSTPAATQPPVLPPTAVPPTNTPVPTPVPYDLTVTVTDTNGNLIAGALVVFPESGSSEPVVTDDAGRAVWTNLDGPNVSLIVTAQGYFKGEQGAALERGPNEVIMNLKRDPFGILPSQACAPGETFLYAEDFQDGLVENWNTYPRGIEIPIGADSNTPENMVLRLDFGATDGEFEPMSVPYQENIVRRMKYMPGNHSRFNVGFGKGNPGYFVVLSADEITLNFYSEATGEQKLARGKPVMAQGVWHLLEFSSYNGRLEVWADGVLAAAFDGAVAIPDGHHIMGIGSAFLPPESIVLVDDVSLCGLSAPFTSSYVAP